MLDGRQNVEKYQHFILKMYNCWRGLSEERNTIIADKSSFLLISSKTVKEKT